jgi:acetyltransferase-like isoleucine patch superfamily enzyme
MKFEDLFRLSLFTFYFNFKYFEFKKAIILPVLFFGKVSIHALKGEIVIPKHFKTGTILIGYNSLGIFEKNIRTVLNIHGKVIFDGKANIGRGFSLTVGKDSEVFFGNNFILTGKSAIVCSGKSNIVFGNNNLISWDVLILNNDFHSIIDRNSKQIINKSKDIIIGNNVWIGCKCTILKGSTINDHIIIGANSLVTGSLNEMNSIYAGTPTTRLKKDVEWLM